MNEIQILGKRVRFQNAVTDVAVTNLTDTLMRVPSAHLLVIRQIDVVPPLMMGTDPLYAGGGSGLGYPRLSERCFLRTVKPENFPINLTLLHEIGHILDHLYACLEHLPPEHRATMRTIRIPPTARTHGHGETYAIGYQQVITGGATDAVRAAILASRAFDGVDMVHP